MRQDRLFGLFICLSLIPNLTSCNKENLLDVYGNILIINEQTYNPIISSVIGEDEDVLSVILFTPYDDSFSGTLLIKKSSIGQMLELYKEQDSLFLSYEQDGNEKTDIQFASGNMKVEKKYRYGILINATDIYGKRFYLSIVPDGLTLHDDGRWF